MFSHNGDCRDYGFDYGDRSRDDRCVNAVRDGGQDHTPAEEAGRRRGRARRTIHEF